MFSKYMERFEDPASEDRALLVVWGSTFPTSAPIEGMVEADRRSYDGWADLVRRGQRDGSIRDDIDADATAGVLLGMTRGIAAVLSGQSGATDPRDVRRTCDVLIAAALAPLAVST